MNKCYNRIVWENYPSDKTPLNEQNLNKIDVATDEMDNRIISLDLTKFDKVDAQLLIKDVTFDLQTGILKKYYYNGPTEEINTGISKLNMNLRFDRERQILYIMNADGTEDPVDLSVFITNYEFNDSDTIAHNVSSDGTVTSIVKDGSIQEKHLRPNYLADIKAESAKAGDSANVAGEKAKEASNSALLSKSYSDGNTGVRTGENTDNAKYYSERAKNSAETSKQYLIEVENAGIIAVGQIKDALDMDKPEFQMDLSTGHLMYTGGRFVFSVNNNNGHLEWGLAV